MNSSEDKRSFVTKYNNLNVLLILLILWWMDWNTLQEISFLLAMILIVISAHLHEIGKKLYNE